MVGTPHADDPALPVRSPWFTRVTVGEGIDVLTEPAVHPLLRANVWHVRGRDRDLVVDTGLGVGSLRREQPQLFARDPVVVVAHAHLDHLGGAHEFTRCHVHPAEGITAPAPASLEAAVLAGQLGLDLDALPGPLPRRLVDAVPVGGWTPAAYRLRPAAEAIALLDGDEVDLGDRRLRVLHLPGHSPGSIALHEPDTGALFSGDVLYDLDEGESLLDDIAGADVGAYVASMRRLADLPVEVLYPGHGPVLGAARSAALVEGYLAGRDPG